MDQTMTTMEAYEAMYDYIEGVYARTQSDTIGALLGSMSTMSDGKPVDAAIWGDWEMSVAKAKCGKVKTRLELL